MSSGRECPFYRDSETLQFGRGIGYCDLDCDRTTCDGNTHFCEKPDALRKYQLQQKRKEAQDRTGEEVPTFRQAAKEMRLQRSRDR
jgi:hypothetical protein